MVIWGMLARMIDDALATIGDLLLYAFGWGLAGLQIGLLLLIAIAFVVNGLLEAWRSSERRPLHMLGIIFWAVIPSWWTIAKITPFAFALWSLNIFMRPDLPDMGGGEVIVGMTLFGCGLLATVAIMLLHEKVQEGEERAKQTLEKWQQREREPKKE